MMLQLLQLKAAATVGVKTGQLESGGSPILQHILACIATAAAAVVAPDVAVITTMALYLLSFSLQHRCRCHCCCPRSAYLLRRPHCARFCH